ncbi:MAG: glycosyltransferase [Ignavibacteriaceae bacterium]|jgi:glycosyltransferase involved in cell wall biosynthesis
MSSNKKVLITFLGNIDYDTRCYNLYNSFKVNGFDVSFTGFDWLTEDFKPVHGEVTIHKLHKGFLSLSFYLKFIWHIKPALFSSRATIFFAEDIYTLPFAVIFGKLKRVKIIYDSRELYGFLAGLNERKFVQYFWKIVEKLFIKHADHIITTGSMDSDVLKEMYGVTNTVVLRNLPRFYKPEERTDLRAQLRISKDQKIMLYQGVILKGRGIEKIFDILPEMSEFVFVLIGGGEFENYYKKLAVERKVINQVFFIGKFSQEDLPKLTPSADVGIALIENISKSYYYALPNKLFEYMMAEVPVVVSNLPQMKEIVDKFNVGFAIDPDNKDELITALENITSDEVQYKKFKQNCKIASKELNWENEIGNLLKFLK